ncbi:MAG: Lrp/AsnC family transcriptional regulator [Nitrososphaerota archaeon]|nr:Lrp/AsnC family transcriptional regulator [Candidatus Bathyarchaeota archaeon]MCX8162064.1 Lrp/AsnC family transcriptional regulator [Candidatus Bathyarchaeota archaeon]MDW8062425.1 Lrp/AsnC family transcriptional regulator [Nitrososphaerota archaeon]
MQIQLDEVDRKILEMLQRNARTPLKRIALALNISEGTVHVRLKRLLASGIIRGFHTILDEEKLGYNVKAIVALKADPSMYSRILESLREVDGVTEIYDVTGEYYAILKVKTTSREELANIIDRIGSIKGVQSTSTMIILRTIKEDLTLRI